MSEPFGDPADLLCALYDTWVDEIGTNQLAAAARRRGSAESLAQSIWTTGAVPPAAREPDNAIDAAITVIGLDLALAPVVRSDGTTSSSAVLPDAHLRLAHTGRLNLRANGALLTKRSQVPRPGPPDLLRDALVSVTRVSPARWKKIDHVIVDPDQDFPGPDPHQMIKIAVMAMSEDLTDFDIHETRDGYHIGPHGPAFTKKRLAEALAVLDGTGARIAVLPEGIVNDGVEQRWREVLAANPNDVSELTWILIGTGPDDTTPPHNRARILHRPTGDRLRSGTGAAFVQDKRAPFTLIPQYVTDYGLADLLPGIVAADPSTQPTLPEDITAGETLTLIEAASGRYCICICEDLTRLAANSPLFQECGPTHVLVPIFAKEIDPNSWPDKRAEEFASEIGASVIVSNSLAIIRARQTVDPTIRNHSALAYRYFGDDKKYPRRHLVESGGPISPVVFDVHSRPSIPPGEREDD